MLRTTLALAMVGAASAGCGFDNDGASRACRGFCANAANKNTKSDCEANNNLKCCKWTASSGGGGATPSGAATLLISEIAEGSSNNKYFEIYNYGKAAVSTKGWSIKLQVNGKKVYTFTGKNAMPASIAAGKGVVWCSSQSSSTILAKCDIKVKYGEVKGSAYVSFNGDDALMLYRGKTLVDIIGQPNKDPGAGWSVAGVARATMDKTLVRKFSSSMKGNPTQWATVGAGSSGTTAANSEWIVKAKNFWSCLGSYTSTCAAGSTANCGTATCTAAQFCHGLASGSVKCEALVQGYSKKATTTQCVKFLPNDSSLKTLAVASAKCEKTTGCSGISDLYCNGMHKTAADNYALCDGREGGGFKTYQYSCVFKRTAGTVTGAAPPPPAKNPTGPATLLISEIAEGSSYNKYFEIYNYGSAAVNMAGWKIMVGSNGKKPLAMAGKNMYSGSIPAGQGVVFCNSKADAKILSKCNVQTKYTKGSADVSFNGNDSLMLMRGSVLIDVIGQANKDPGAGWDVAGVTTATKDRTLVRKYSSSMAGNPTQWSTPGAGSSGKTASSSEWLVKPKNFWSCLGAFTSTCAGGGSPPPPVKYCTSSSGIGSTVGSYTTLSKTMQCSYYTKANKRLLYEVYGDKCTSASACGAACTADAKVHTGSKKCKSFYMYTATVAGQKRSYCIGLDGVADKLYGRNTKGKLDAGQACYVLTSALNTKPPPAPTPTPSPDTPQTLLISEVAEGSSNNKYFEIYNYGSKPVAFNSNWAIKSQSNKKTNWDSTFSGKNFPASGTTIGSGRTLVFCNAAADKSIIAKCDVKTKHSYGNQGVAFNGNDAFAILYKGSVIDQFGPMPTKGKSFAIAGVKGASKDKTLVRKTSVKKGNKGQWAKSAGTGASNSEWLVRKKNFWACLGSYGSTSCSASIAKPPPSPPSPSNCAGTKCAGGSFCHGTKTGAYTCEKITYSKSARTLCGAYLSTGDSTLTTLAKAEAKCERTVGCSGVSDAYCNGLKGGVKDNYALCKGNSFKTATYTCVFKRQKGAVKPAGCKATGIGGTVSGYTTLSKTKQCSYNTKANKRLLYEVFKNKCTPAACAAACAADAKIHTGNKKCVAFYMYTTKSGVSSCRGINGVPDKFYSSKTHTAQACYVNTAAAAKAASVDCAGGWGSWSACSVSCGAGGQQTKTWNNYQMPKNGGKACSRQTGSTDSQTCPVKACPPPPAATLANVSTDEEGGSTTTVIAVVALVVAVGGVGFFASQGAAAAGSGTKAVEMDAV